MSSAAHRARRNADSVHHAIYETPCAAELIFRKEKKNSERDQESNPRHHLGKAAANVVRCATGRFPLLLLMNIQIFPLSDYWPVIFVKELDV